jgi:glutamyl-tRNA synthetase
VQSERKAFYYDAWRKLLRGGYLFPCRCSRKDLEAALSAPYESLRSDAKGNRELEVLDDEPVYPGTCRLFEGRSSQASYDTNDEIVEQGGFTWRFRVPDGEVIEFEDRNLGWQRFVAGDDFGDFVVWRRDGNPSYQLACVADDAAMKITEVVRGEDLLKSTARQILLNRALGFNDPEWYHCRLVMDANGRRLAKRHDALSLRAMRLNGATPNEVQEQVIG